MKKIKAAELLLRNIEESGEVKNKLPLIARDIEKASDALRSALRKGKKIIVFGNGGSAADAQHFAAELVCRFEKNRAPARALARTANTSNLTAIANDFGYEYSFSRQVEALGNKGDAVLAISTSGNSPNVLKAASSARRIGLKVIALSGCGGGRLKKLSDINIIVPSKKTARIQESHILILHTLCQAIESDL